MNKRRYLISIFVFAALVSLYYYGVRPMLGEGGETLFFKDDFTSMNTDFWFVGSMQTNEELKGAAKIDEGTLTLQKTAKGEDLYFLSKPLKMGKKQVLILRRKLDIHPGKEYFSGGFVVFQTNSKANLVSSDEKFPYGSALIMLEYVKDPTGKTDRPGKNNIRLLSPGWKEKDNALLIKPIYEKEFEEEIVYNAYTGVIEYKAGGKKYRVEASPLREPYIKIWMHAFGHSAKQRINVHDFELEIKNLEDLDLEE